MKIHLFAALGLALAASGCVTSAAEQRAFDEQRCRSYGFKAGSEALSSCLLDLDLDRSADRRAWMNSDFGPYRYGVGFRRW